MKISKAVGATAIAGLLATLAGCANSPIPLAQNFELTSQYKVRSAGHWDLVSRDVVGQTAATLDKAGERDAFVELCRGALAAIFLEIAGADEAADPAAGGHPTHRQQAGDFKLAVGAGEITQHAVRPIEDAWIIGIR